MTMLMWGIVTIVFVDPIDVGMGITSFFLIAIACITIYLVSLSPVRLAEALMCIDESELLTATEAVIREGMSGIGVVTGTEAEKVIGIEIERGCGKGVETGIVLVAMNDPVMSMTESGRLTP